MTLAELKNRATELGLTPDDVRAYGSLTKKATWEAAISEKENTIAQPQASEATVEQSSNEPVEQSQAEELGTVATPNPEPVQTTAIIPFRPVLSEIAKPDNSGYLVWSNKFKNWVKEKPENSSTPIRDKLFAKMQGYIGKGISLSDLEEMQKESPDEKTAAIYLAVLEESERLLIEAVAA